MRKCSCKMNKRRSLCGYGSQVLLSLLIFLSTTTWTAKACVDGVNDGNWSSDCPLDSFDDDCVYITGGTPSSCTIWINGCLNLHIDGFVLDGDKTALTISGTAYSGSSLPERGYYGTISGEITWQTESSQSLLLLCFEQSSQAVAPTTPTTTTEATLPEDLLKKLSDRDITVNALTHHVVEDLLIEGVIDANERQLLDEFLMRAVAPTTPTTTTEATAEATTTTKGLCDDVLSFRDREGHACDDWKAYDCFHWEGYSAQELEVIQEKCTLSCGLCHDEGDRSIRLCTAFKWGGTLSEWKCPDFAKRTSTKGGVEHWFTVAVGATFNIVLSLVVGLADVCCTIIYHLVNFAIAAGTWMLQTYLDGIYYGWGLIVLFWEWLWMNNGYWWMALFGIPVWGCVSAGVTQSLRGDSGVLAAGMGCCTGFLCLGFGGPFVIFGLAALLYFILVVLWTIVCLVFTLLFLVLAVVLLLLVFVLSVLLVIATAFVLGIVWLVVFILITMCWFVGSVLVWLPFFGFEGAGVILLIATIKPIVGDNPDAKYARMLHSMATGNEDNTFVRVLHRIWHMVHFLVLCFFRLLLFLWDIVVLKAAVNSFVIFTGLDFGEELAEAVQRALSQALPFIYNTFVGECLRLLSELCNFAFTWQLSFSVSVMDMRCPAGNIVMVAGQLATGMMVLYFLNLFHLKPMLGHLHVECEAKASRIANFVTFIKTLSIKLIELVFASGSATYIYMIIPQKSESCDYVADYMASAVSYIFAGIVGLIALFILPFIMLSPDGEVPNLKDLCLSYCALIPCVFGVWNESALNMCGLDRLAVGVSDGDPPPIVKKRSSKNNDKQKATDEGGEPGFQREAGEDQEGEGGESIIYPEATDEEGKQSVQGEVSAEQEGAGGKSDVKPNATVEGGEPGVQREVGAVHEGEGGKSDAKPSATDEGEARGVQGEVGAEHEGEGGKSDVRPQATDEGEGPGVQGEAVEEQEGEGGKSDVKAKPTDKSKAAMIEWYKKDGVRNVLHIHLTVEIGSAAFAMFPLIGPFLTRLMLNMNKGSVMSTSVMSTGSYDGRSFEDWPRERAAMNRLAKIVSAGTLGRLAKLFSATKFLLQVLTIFLPGIIPKISCIYLGLASEFIVGVVDEWSSMHAESACRLLADEKENFFERIYNGFRDKFQNCLSALQKHLSTITLLPWRAYRFVQKKILPMKDGVATAQQAAGVGAVVQQAAGTADNVFGPQV